MTRFMTVPEAAKRLGITSNSVMYRAGKRQYESRIIEGRTYIGLPSRSMK